MKTLTIEQRFDRLEEEIVVIKKMLSEILNRNTVGSKDPNLNEIMTVKQLADLINFDLNVIYAKCVKGEIPYFKIGKQYRFNKIDILNWIKTQKSQSAFSIDSYVDRYLQKHELKG